MSLSRFGVTHPVPVNILMGVFIIAGLVSALTMTREFFPETNPHTASVTLPYPGATPEEIEESLARKVEDKLADLDEVERLTTTIAEGGGGISVEFRDGIEDVGRATDEVERAIDTLTDLPDEAERIQVAAFEVQLPVIMLTLFGDADAEALKRSIERIRDDLRTLPDMGDTVRSGIRDYEIRVDASADALLEHGLSLPQVSDAIKAWMTDLPGGTVRTGVGNINVRTLGVEERSSAIRDIVVRATVDGQVLYVGDIATVQETYVDTQIKTRFRTREGGGPSASLTIYKVGDQDAVKMAEMVREYVRARKFASGDESAAFEPYIGDRVFALLEPAMAGSGKPAPRTHRRLAYELGLNAPYPLPIGARIETSSDLARFIEGRLDLLSRNALWGGMLVFATLLIFLNWRTALWVGIGLTTALCGTLIFMRLTGTTLNLLTMFGLIVVLGLLVDDAIVVAENIQARHERHEPALVAAIRGTEEVFWPVVATILTSIVAFMPLLFISGQIGDLMDALPWVVACALVMSLIESVLILPCHMGHTLVNRDRHRAANRQEGPGRIGRLEAARDRVIHQKIIPAYAWLLRRTLRYRYITLCAALCALIVSIGMVAGGRSEFEFLPSSDAETLIVELDMPIGTALEETERYVARIEEAAASQTETKSISTLLGVKASVDGASGVAAAGFGTHLGQIFIELEPVEFRDRESSAITASIREALGVMDGVERLSFADIQGGPAGKDITIQVTGNDPEEVRSVVDEVKRLVATMDGVFDIADNDSAGQREVQITLKPGAAALGFSVADVARQVRGALFGLNPHVFSEFREDIDVRVRLDDVSRRSLHAIENMWVISPAGQRVPLQEIASLEEGASYNTIHRIDRRRTTTVTADTAPDVSPETVVPALTPQLRVLEAEHPAITIDFGGRQRQMRKAFESLPIGFLAALILIYVILAWLFGSYAQPIAVMLAIPFGMIGVIWGHLIMGYPLTFFSIIGFVALSGIVVNDSLILVQFFNVRRQAGEAFVEAMVAAGRQRLRPILLTTITTILGLTPLMLEQSFQAKFLIPMAISIAFGLMSATVLILLVLPSLMVIFDDAKAISHLVWHGLPRAARAAPIPILTDIEAD